MLAWENSQIILTGGGGFLGQRVIAALHRHGITDIIAPRRADFDLRREAEVAKLFEHAAARRVAQAPQVVIHLAANVGGIGYNRERPGELFYDNMAMGLLLMEGARRAGVDKFVAVGTVCAYPKFASVPFREDDLWDGYPEETNAPYGLAKKMLLVQAQAYRQQYGFNAIYLLPVNLYGPGDNFDLASSHVIPALIRKFLEAKANGAEEVEVWGDGSPTREFLYVDDAAEGIVLAAKEYSGAEPVNLGSGQEISIRDLAESIAQLTEYRGRIVWNRDKPNGQPRRCLDVSRARAEFGFVAQTSFVEGLAHTIGWYRGERMVFESVKNMYS